MNSNHQPDRFSKFMEKTYLECWALPIFKEVWLKYFGFWVESSRVSESIVLQNVTKREAIACLFPLSFIGFLFCTDEVSCSFVTHSKALAIMQKLQKFKLKLRLRGDSVHVPSAP